MIELDAIDKQILEILQQDARISHRSLANKIGLTASPTIERVKRLEREGVIRGYRAIIDKPLVDQGLSIFVKVTLSVHQMSLLDEFTRTIDSIPNILACYHTTGQGDFLLQVVARDMSDYERLLREQLTTLPDIERLETTMVLRTMKEDGVLPIT